MSHCCIRAMLKAMPDTAGQAHGSKPESLKSVGVFFLFCLLFFPLPAQKITETVFSIVKNTGKRGSIYHSSFSAGKGPFEKDRG